MYDLKILSSQPTSDGGVVVVVTLLNGIFELPTPIEK